jgi:hypothetical protein
VHTSHFVLSRLALLVHAEIGAVGAVAAGPAEAPPTHLQLVLLYVTVYGPPNVTAGVPPHVVQAAIDPELLLELLPPEPLPLDVLPLELLAEPELLPEAPELDAEPPDPEPDPLPLDDPDDDDPVELPEPLDPEPLEPADPLEPELLELV